MRSQHAGPPADPGPLLDADIVGLQRIRSSKARTIKLTDADLRPLPGPRFPRARPPAKPRALGHRHPPVLGHHQAGPGLADQYRIVILGTAIALDLLRVKKRAVAAAG